MYIFKSFFLFFVNYQYNLNYTNDLENKFKKESFININNKNSGYDSRNETNNITIDSIKINYNKKNFLDIFENKEISINNKLKLIEYYNYIFNEKSRDGGLFDDWNNV
jgi:hypothetical protein